MRDESNEYSHLLQLQRGLARPQIGWLSPCRDQSRGKGQQKVTVEHVQVHSGGQAIVGMVEGPALDNSPKPERQPNAKQIAHAPQPAMQSPNPEPEVVPSASDAERPMPNARRNVTGSTEGK